MKRLLVFLFASALVVCLASPLMAGGIDNKHNYSAEYIRTLNRNGATDSADGVVYNPAGTVKMEDGFYVNLAGQYVMKDYSDTIDGVEYKSDEADLAPGLFALFSKDRWSAYGAFTIPAGGGSVKFEDGSGSTEFMGRAIAGEANIEANNTLTALGLPPAIYYDYSSQEIEGESYYYGGTFGGAFAVNDIFSFSLGGRYIDAHKDMKGSVIVSDVSGLGLIPPELATIPVMIDFEDTASGWGGIIGLNFGNEQLNLGVRYETKTALEFTTKVKTDTMGMLTDGAKYDRDLPAILGVGIGGNITPQFRAEADLTYYFNEDADWTGNMTSQNGLIELSTGATGLNTDRDNGYDVGIALEYAFTDQWLASFGYMFTETGIDADNMVYEAPELDAHSIAAGVKWSATPRLDLNLGVLKTFYQSETTTPIPGLFPTGVKLEKDVIDVALSIQYKFW